jgi:hypothetical protein
MVMKFINNDQNEHQLDMTVKNNEATAKVLSSLFDLAKKDKNGNMLVEEPPYMIELGQSQKIILTGNILQAITQMNNKQLLDKTTIMVLNDPEEIELKEFFKENKMAVEKASQQKQAMSVINNNEQTNLSLKLI